MRWLVRLLLFIIVIGWFFSLKLIVLAEEPVFITLFYSQTCPHCIKEKKFLENLADRRQYVQLRQLDVAKYGEVFQLVSQQLDRPAVGVPYTVIGEEVIVGYLSDTTTGQQIEQIILRHTEIGCTDIVGEVMREKGLLPNEGLMSGQSCPEEKKETNRHIELNLPVIGRVNIADLSLPLLTVLIAFMDGFNPCAMWILLFLITLLLNLKDKKKLLILGSTFIVISGLVYFIFLAAWLNVFFFLGFISWIRIVVGIVAIISGYIHLRGYWLNRTGCPATDKHKRRQIINRINRVVSAKSFWLALVGISVLAVSVNLLELVCSAGLPAIYTQVLSLAKLPSWQYYLYLILYIVIFILDDLVVFLIAVKTWHTIGVSAKFNRYSSLIGGLVILVLGLLLIFKPEWVMFA